FFVGVKNTRLQPGELAIAIELPAASCGLRSAFDKIKRVQGHDLALVNAAVSYDPEGKVLRAVIGSCGVTPLPMPDLSAIDPNQNVEEVAERLAKLAVERISPISDVRASAEYRRDMAALLCKRLVRRVLHARYPISLTINGERYDLEVPAERTLLTLLKDDLEIHSPKLGCGIGECGVCTIIVNGEAVNACMTLAVEADGATIQTAEGETELGKLSTLQQAFIDHGAVQCGFCTPGMINSARALLEKTPHPTREEIVEAIAGNYCRCTGYDAIIAAIEAVAKGEYVAKPALQAPYVGKAQNRLDGVDKVTGTATFVHDMVVPRMLIARMLTSPHASARIVRVDTSKAAALEGVKAVLTGADLEGVNKLGLYMQDKEILARDRVRYQGEPVAAVAAETLAQAQAAVAAIEVEYELLEPVLDVHQALRQDAPQVHPNLADYSWMDGVFFPSPGKNIAHHQKIRKGDMQAGFAAAHKTYEHSFENPPVQHVPMETHTAIVTAKPGGEVEIISSAQSPFAVQQIFCHTFNMPHHQVRVRVPYVGGGFGGKAGIHLEPLIYLLSRAAKGRPVKLTATREEEFNTLPSRQGLSSRIKTGVKADGTITALQVTYLWDAGAYADYGVNIGRAAAYAGAGPYVVPNCHIDSEVVYTNKVFGTAYRGFGHLEVLWGIERNLDLIAHDLGIDGLELRKKNLLHVGETTITGEVFTAGHGKPEECLRLVAEAIDYEPQVRPPAPLAPQSGKVRAKGLAMLHKAPAMPTYTSCSVILKFTGDGSVTLLVSGVDYGQGTYTMLAQVAADELGISVEKVRVPWDSDTDFTPYDWQTVASRFAVMGGNATIAAAQDALRQIKEVAAQALHAPVELIDHGDEQVWVRGRREETTIPYSKIILGYAYDDGSAIGGPVIGRGRYIAQGLTNLDPQTGQGRPALNWTYGAHAVEIEVDTDTGEIRVVQIASAFDVGKVLNEQQCRAQVIGGVVQGLGSALFEKFVFDGGRLINNSFVDYKLPTAKDLPMKMQQLFVETPHPQGPYGARGVAEHPMISVPSAIGNALANATGVELHELPLDAERVYLALKYDKQL
ncbi:MAG: molybdopterin-dependent oxidoreductase, partial [Deltaproteobacteria bacterium]|nr:molybdopterin-dependent oxidoreductase [Deltaproteobacteria bacterium]